MQREVQLRGQIVGRALSKKMMFREGSTLAICSESCDHTVAKIAKAIHTKVLLDKENLLDLIETIMDSPTNTVRFSGGTS
jgi:sugar (pentulose or hexulose) kinase